MSNLKQVLQFKIDSMARLGLADPRYMAIERFVMEHGVLKRGRKLPKPYRVGRMKECFRNAAMLSLDNRDLVYTEGFAWRDGLPIDFRHAWVEDPCGQVIDITWRKTTEKEEYLGVQIPRDVLVKNIVKTKYASVFWRGELELPNLKILPKILAATKIETTG